MRSVPGGPHCTALKRIAQLALAMCWLCEPVQVEELVSTGGVQRRWRRRSPKVTDGFFTFTFSSCNYYCFMYLDSVLDKDPSGLKVLAMCNKYQNLRSLSICSTRTKNRRHNMQIYHVIVHHFPKKNTVFDPIKALSCPNPSKKCVKHDKS